MIMKTVLVVLAVATLTHGHDYFTKRFAYMQVMAKCVGEKTYYDWLGEIMAACKECHHEPVSMMHKHHDHHHHESDHDSDVMASIAELLRGDKPLFIPIVLNGGKESTHSRSFLDILHSRQKRSPMYDAQLLKKLMHKAIAKVSNFTCVMQKLNFADEDLNLKVEDLKDVLRDLTPNRILNQDLVKSVDDCNKFSSCLPEDHSPMPAEIKKLTAFMKCFKKHRMGICMKQDILKYLEIFDVSGLPFETSDEGALAEKLLHVLWGSEAQEVFEVY